MRAAPFGLSLLATLALCGCGLLGSAAARRQEALNKFAIEIANDFFTKASNKGISFERFPDGKDMALDDVKLFKLKIKYKYDSKFLIKQYTTKPNNVSISMRASHGGPIGIQATIVEKSTNGICFDQPDSACECQIYFVVSSRAMNETVPCTLPTDRGGRDALRNSITQDIGDALADTLNGNA
ncbi:MAG: hypothetical protein WA840_19730 [Caulobacteraceae bacterium]